MSVNVYYKRPATQALIEEVQTTLLPLVVQVCDQAGIELPLIAFTSRRRGCYKPKRTGGEIVISQQSALEDKGYTKYVLCHEMAHHVDYLKNMAASYPRRAEDRKSHDRIFFKTLLEVIQVFFGDVAEYPWWREYPSLRTWARQKGIPVGRPDGWDKPSRRAPFTFAGRVYRELTMK